MRLSTGGRLALTVWLAYALHFSSNVVRETYLALSLAERGSVRVDEYLGLHPDLFAIAGRGAYINNNPGASLVGAVPQLLARPALALLFRLRPGLVAPKPPGAYDDPRPNRTRFMNEARARGLDIKLVLAALVQQVGAVAPLGALTTVLLFGFLRRRLGDERQALAFALVFAFATPQFFRSAFLSQNLLIAQASLGAFLLYAWPRAPDAAPVDPRARTHVLAGLLLGFSLLCDYSAAPLALAFGLHALWLGWRGGGSLARGVRAGALFTFGAVGPIALLFGYQALAFGSPWSPAQRYMPPTPYSVLGWNGLTLPTADLLWRNLVDPRYGIFAFSPLLLAALAAPWLKARRGGPARDELALIFGASLGLYLFSSANQFANLQWNTGVRYLVPAGALLFVAAVPALLAAPRWLRWTLVGASLLIQLAVSMTREDVVTALRVVFTQGPQLPVLIVARKTAEAYAPWLQSGWAAAGLAILAYLALGALLWLVWRGWDTRATHEA